MASHSPSPTPPSDSQGRRSPSQPQSQSQSPSQPQAPPSPDSDAARKKAWAPRVRTGCSTCRGRRVKCDETQPICRNCAIKNRPCSYTLVWRQPGDERPRKGASPGSCSPEGLSPETAAPAPARETNALVRARKQVCIPRRQVEPPDWDFIEGMRFFINVVVPIHTSNQGPESDYVKQYDSLASPANFPSKTSFLMLMTCARIKITLASEKAPLRRDAGTNVDHLWRNFYRYMARAIADLNVDITARLPVRNLLYRIVDLLSVELAIMDSQWRAHLEGFFALVQFYGGVAGIIKSSERPPVLGLAFGLMHAAAGNSCSPANDQIRGVDRWSEHDILSTYTSSYYACFPCPSRLFLAIVRITRLRVLVAGRGNHHDAEPAPDRAALVYLADTLALDLHDFCPSTWEEVYQLPTEPLRSRLAGVFHSAVVLYALLSLPPYLAQRLVAMDPELNAHSPQSDVSPGSEAGSEALTPPPPVTRAWARLHYRGKLVEQVRAATQLNRPSDLTWALAVLGMAVSDGTGAERGLVVECLEDAIGEKDSYCGPATLLEMLPRFWASGKTGWEDCYDRPCQILA